ncbi:MAG TPA: isochorismatase family cysteine hydrolase [Caldimonas sp.]|jgi:nicotinamidase-related amidase|nr:isochorismatase family cysteine hydrolase [Caldimonas sp.]HEX2543021.1 isochorismatase family cysteine hydrolase [Caldimonas sp.]
MPVAPERAPLAAEAAHGGKALLVIDMISAWDFPNAARLAAGAVAIAGRIGALKRRCHAAGVPAIYVNDNHGHWRSDFRQVVQRSLERGGPAGRAIAEALRPGPDDYSVLKPKHSAFFATPLDLLLRHLRARTLIVTGVATDQCIVMSASDAHMRDYEVVVPQDCVAAQTEDRNRRALEYLREAQKVKTTVSTRVRLPAGKAGGKRGV